jgi:putative isomerase
MMMHGLMNYGYSAQARELAQKTVDMLVDDLKKNGGMNECYNPETGTGGADGHFVSWNLLAGHMIEEAASGTDPAGL